MTTGRVGIRRPYLRNRLIRIILCSLFSICVGRACLPALRDLEEYVFAHDLPSGGIPKYNKVFNISCTRNTVKALSKHVISQTFYAVLWKYYISVSFVVKITFVIMFLLLLLFHVSPSLIDCLNILRTFDLNVSLILIIKIINKYK